MLLISNATISQVRIGTSDCTSHNTTLMHHSVRFLFHHMFITAKADVNEYRCLHLPGHFAVSMGIS